MQPSRKPQPEDQSKERMADRRKQIEQEQIEQMRAYLNRDRLTSEEVIAKLEALKGLFKEPWPTKKGDIQASRKNFLETLLNIQQQRLIPPENGHPLEMKLLIAFRQFFRALPDNAIEARRLGEEIDGDLSSLVALYQASITK